MISLVIPVHNEEAVLPLLLRRIRETAPAWNEPYEVVFVDDGSTDGSLSLLRAARAADARLAVIKLSRNFGHQAAITAGLVHAQGDAVVVLDADLQDPPEVIGRFIDRWRAGDDVVYGVRRARKESFARRAVYSLFYRALHAMSDIEIPRDSGDFCLMDRKVVHALNVMIPEQVRFVRGLRAYAGFRQSGVVYEREARAAGTPSYNVRQLIGLAVNGLFGFSLLPLRMASIFGFIVAVPSFLIGIFLIVQRIIGFRFLGRNATDVPGMATLGVGIFFMSGLILITLGVIGEYLGRIYLEVKRRPLYIVESVEKR
jgi:glycosyltransferase involved in cell wall biosynthesis